jgi:hypothetical protein
MEVRKMKEDIIRIGNHRFDKEKARLRFTLEWSDDDGEFFGGEAFMSPHGIWYIEVPEHWAERNEFGLPVPPKVRHWEILPGKGEKGAEQLFKKYGKFVFDCDAKEVSDFFSPYC